MRDVLLVGASGPLGRSLAAELDAAGHAVHGVSRSGRAGTGVLDVADRDASASLLRALTPSAVVYLARPDLESDSVRLRDDAVRSLASFARQCAEAGVRRFLFASSSAVYGTGHHGPLAEGAALDLAPPYADLKRRSELALAEVAAASGMSALSFRVFNVYGPGFHQSLVNRLLGRGEVPEVFETEQFVRDYIHSADVARAFVEALREHGGPDLLNLGTGEPTSNSRLLELCPGAVYRARSGEGVDSWNFADTSLLHAALAIEPATRLDLALGNVDRYF